MNTAATKSTVTYLHSATTYATTIGDIRFHVSLSLNQSVVPGRQAALYLSKTPSGIKPNHLEGSIYGQRVKLNVYNPYSNWI